MDKVDNRRIEMYGLCKLYSLGENGGIMEEKLREEDAGRGEDGKNERGGKYLNFWKCVGKGTVFKWKMVWQEFGEKRLRALGVSAGR